MTQVLVVDDDKAIRELLTIALEFEGYTVETLSDGADVVATLEAQDEPCLVLMDLMMPRVDGLTVCAWLLERPTLLERHRIVIMTACPPHEDECPPPASALVRKPFELDRLLGLVRSLMATPHVAQVTRISLCSDIALAG